MGDLDTQERAIWMIALPKGNAFPGRLSFRLHDPFNLRGQPAHPSIQVVVK
jgi:hypothetical protein